MNPYRTPPRAPLFVYPPRRPPWWRRLRLLTAQNP